jgi:Do/DeqQ family serine protease
VRTNSLLALSLVLGLSACDQQNATAAATDEHPLASPARVAADTSPGTAAPPTLAPMLARVSPAVVNISVQGTVQTAQNPLFQDPLFRRFFGLPEDQTPQNAPAQRFQAVGSGVIFDAERGYVITNNHVVNRADKILITLKDRRQLTAKLVAADPQTDVAVLKVEGDHLTSLPLGDSKRLQVGDYVVAIGNPFGVGQTATFGIVSAVGRTGLGIESYEDFIQTDASINPGNSGGALVDMAGRLIGMNAAIISRGGGNVGVGFAIPIDLVKTVADQLIAKGKVSRGALGVTVQDLTPALAQAMGINLAGGALVSQVLPHSAAAKAGIEEGDVITALDGEPMTGSSQLRNAVGQKQPGTTVRLSLLHQGKERSVTATLEPLAATASAAPAGTREETPMSGMTLGAIPQNDPHYGKLKGVSVMSVERGSAAEEAGLQKGDIIVSAGRTPVSTPSELAAIARDQKKGAPLLLQVRRGESMLYIAIG